LQRPIAKNTINHPACNREILRMDDPLVANQRITTRKVNIHNRVIPKGENISLMWIAANRDPRVFNDPDIVQINREDKRKFGLGARYPFLFGGTLARLECA
jgi:cytochrome P450